MAKIQSEKEKKLQKKLIPLNIFVCILCLVASISLMFAPIFKIDIGKIVRNEGFKNYVDTALNGMLKQSSEGENDAMISPEAFMPVVSTVVNNVLNTAEGSLTVSAFGASKVAFASGDDKSKQLMDELLFGENALVTKLIDSVVKGVTDLIKPAPGQTTPFYEIVEDTVIKAITTNLVKAETPYEIKEQDVEKLVETFKSIENVEDGKVDSVVTSLFDQVNEITNGDVTFSEEQKTEVINTLQEYYDDTVKELAKAGGDENVSVTMESLICVAISKNVDLKEFNISEILNDIMNMGGAETTPEEQPEGRAVRLAVTAEAEDGENNGETDGGNDGENNGETGGESGGENNGETDGGNGGENREIVTSYAGLVEKMGLDDETINTLKQNLKTTLESKVNEFTGEAEQYMGYYGYIFYAMLIFAAPWAILFLFSLIHIFAKNKRFMMWYVKLYSFIPGLISLAIILAPTVMRALPQTSEMFDDKTGALVEAVLSGVSSLMWISGVCYVLLWLASIFWAFPIKHKIRKERKAVKKYGVDYEQGLDYGSGDYTGSDYGEAGGLYVDPDDDIDGFNSPYEGSLSDYGYGSLFDDDDDLF